MDPVARVVIEIAGILLLGALGEFIFARTRVPDVVWLVAAGILAGPISGLIPSVFSSRASRFLGRSPLQSFCRVERFVSNLPMWLRPRRAEFFWVCRDSFFP